MELEKMKEQWTGLNSGNNNSEININNQKLDKMKTAQQQLVNQYRAFAGLAGIFPILSYVILSRLGVNEWIELGVVIFFFVSAMMDFYLQRKVGEINLGNMSVTEVVKKAASCRRLHHIFQLILIPSGIVLLAFLAYDMTDNTAFIYDMTDNTAFIYGMCIGGAIGLAAGLKAYFKFMDNYKSLIKE